MLYYLKNEFAEINKPAGIIQNLSPFTLEVSYTDEPNSGTMIFPHQSHYFSDAPVYVRCVDGTAKTRVITEGVNSCEMSEMNFDCCSSNALLCSPCCGADISTVVSSEGDGIKGVILDDVEQYINADNFVVLDLSAYLKNNYDNITYLDIANLFN